MSMPSHIKRNLENDSVQYVERQIEEAIDRLSNKEEDEYHLPLSQWISGARHKARVLEGKAERLREAANRAEAIEVQAHSQAEDSKD